MKVFNDPGFRIHFIVYVAVNALLVMINLLGNADHVWFYWPLIGWGIGLLAHGAAVNKKQIKALT